MSTTWRKAMSYLGLVDELDADVDEAVRTVPRVAPDPEPTVRLATPDEIDLRAPEPVLAPVAAAPAPPPAAAQVAEAEPDNVRPLRPAARRTRSREDTASHVAVVPVDQFDQVEPVAVRLRARQPVVLDLAGADKATARRVLDFVSGAVFLADAALQPLGNRAFLVLPTGIEVSSTERRRLSNLGYVGVTG